LTGDATLRFDGGLQTIATENRMKRAQRIVALVLIATASIASIAQDGTGARSSPSTVWTASPLEAERIARVESQVSAGIRGEDPIELTIQQWMETFKIPGLSVAVFDRYALVWAKTYGTTKPGGPEPVTLDTLFQAGSISKPVTAMAALHFVEAGKWSLDRNINDKLRSWKLPENEFTSKHKVTLRRLLSHTAGTTVHGFPGYAVTDPVPGIVQVLDGEPPANTAPVRVDIAPGTKGRYSGGGTTIVQLMMIDQLGKPFPQIMQETVLQPLGLTHSTYEQPLPSERAAMAATGTRADGTAVEGKWHLYPEMAAAGLWTTPSDLAGVAIEVSKAYEGKSARVLSRAMTRRMLTEQLPGAGIGFGLGFAVGPGPTQFGHNGADEGFQAYLTAFADIGSGVAIMANSDNGSMVFDRLAASIAREYHWPSLATREPSPAETVALLAYVRGTERAIGWFKAASAAEPGEAFGPRVLNDCGYRLLRSGKIADAVKLFEANVEMYPGDANAYDSLGEGQMDAGLKTEAIANYRKSLQMNPANANAAKMLEMLGAK
jgi:CubicO group peptidase (beta-lactamase class C family)